MRFNLDKGLGKHFQGRKELIKAVPKHSQTGFDFKLELKHWGKKQKMVSFKLPEKTTMITKYPDDPKFEETQDLIPLWALPKASPKNSCETTRLFIPSPENFKSSINRDQVKIFYPPPQYSSACQHIPSFSNLSYVPEIVRVILPPPHKI